MTHAADRTFRESAFSRFALALIAVLVSLTSASVTAQVPGRCEMPVSERKGDIGCYVSATQDLGPLPDLPLFWHIYVFQTRAAAEAAKAPRSSIVEAFGKIWLYSIAEREWLPSTGQRIAVVGPLPHSADKGYTVRYLEGVIPPGERTPVHTHAGPEAWYLVAGAQCLETPDGHVVANAGDSLVVREALPMVLSSVGTEMRNSLVLILHDSAKPWTMVMQDGEWKPAGRCPK